MHANPSPQSSDQMDWSVHYPKYFSPGESKGEKQVEWADVGCGFGGLLMALAPQFPETLMLGESREERTRRSGDLISLEEAGMNARI